MKIVFAETLNIGKEELLSLTKPLTQAGHEVILYTDKPSKEEMARRCRQAEVAVIANTSFRDEAIRQCTKLKKISVAFAGIDHVGKAACAERNIQVLNAAGYSDETVAEMVIGQTISLLRKTKAADAAVRSGLGSAGFCGGEIMGRTVGIIGTGRIGLRTAQLFKAFGAKVISYSRTCRAEAEQMGIVYVSLQELLKKSDIVSLHVPLTEETRSLIGERELGMMKPTALLINCARGPVVDGNALANALNSDLLAGAAVDVYDKEPPLEKDHPLLSVKNLLLTPHTGYFTTEAMERRAKIACENARP